MNEPKRYSKALKQVPIILEEDGTEEIYILQEVIGADRDSYLTSLSGRVRTDAEGKAVGVKNFDGMQASLLCRSLFFGEEVEEENGDEDEDAPKVYRPVTDAKGRMKPVPMSVIQSWASRIQDDLFKQAKEMSSLDDKAEAKQGND